MLSIILTLADPDQKLDVLDEGDDQGAGPKWGKQEAVETAKSDQDLGRADQREN